MMTEFQKQYGEQFASMVRSPAFMAAMQELNLRKINSIADLNDLQIETDSKTILADLRGYLRHENDLMRLTELPTEVVDIGPEEYLPDLVVENEPDATQEPSEPIFVPQISAPPKPRKPRSKK